jgi:hypothetical protein
MTGNCSCLCNGFGFGTTAVSRGARSDHGRGGQTDPVVEPATKDDSSATSWARLVNAGATRSGDPAWRLPGRPN